METQLDVGKKSQKDAKVYATEIDFYMSRWQVLKQYLAIFRNLPSDIDE